MDEVSQLKLRQQDPPLGHHFVFPKALLFNLPLAFDGQGLIWNAKSDQLGKA